MRKQQQIWLEEHTNPDLLPSLAKIEPGSGVVAFADFLKTKHADLTAKKIIDIGCGKGRNAIFLAQKSLDVYAIDYIQPALDIAREIAEEQNVSKNIHFLQAAIDEGWPFEDNFFDYAVDCFSSIDIETKTGREIYRDEMLRTLRPGGYAMVNVCSSDDEWESEAITKRPGSEPNSAFWPNGKFQKNYDEAELREFYKDFTIIELKKISKPAEKLGRHGTATNFWLVLQK